MLQKNTCEISLATPWPQVFRLRAYSTFIRLSTWRRKIGVSVISGLHWIARDSLKWGNLSEKRPPVFSITDPLNALSANVRTRRSITRQKIGVSRLSQSIYVTLLNLAMELVVWCCFWYWRFLLPLALQERSAHFKHKYTPFLEIATQKRKAHVLSMNRWQPAFGVDLVF